MRGGEGGGGGQVSSASGGVRGSKDGIRRIDDDSAVHEV